MGNWFSSESGLEKYSFEDPYIPSSTFNFSDKEVYIVDNEISAEEASNKLRKQGTLYVDCEGGNFGNRGAELGTVQIAISDSCCYIFKLKCKKEFEVLKDILESKHIKKVFHDCSGDIAALAVAEICGRRGIFVPDATVHDTQIAQLFVHKRTRNVYADEDALNKLSIAAVYNYTFDEDFPHVRVPPHSPNKWLSGELTEAMIKYAALHVLMLPKMFRSLKKDIGDFWGDYRAMVVEHANCKRRNLID